MLFADLLPILVSFLLALALTPIVRLLARRWSMVARPKQDRWHTKPTAMMGGVAVFLACTAAMLAIVPPTPQSLVVLGASAFLFIVGLVDDLLHIKPYQKLIGQVCGAALIVGYGLQLPWTNSPLVNAGFTLVWLIGITNAINLLDNMDGLAAGIAAIAAIFLALAFAANGQTIEVAMLLVFAGALIGFLVYNTNPASIFMGDCGSMFIGFFLASASLLTAAGAPGRTRSLLPVLAVPVLILFIPIFDTTFVTVLRKLSGRAASQGGRDHTSHRLVALGLTERRAVFMLYLFATLAGLLALFVREMSLDVSLAAIGGFTVVLVLLGVYLAGVKVYSEEEIAAARERPLVSFLVDLSYKRRVFEVFLDILLITLAYYGAYVLLFGPADDSYDWRMFLQTLPVIVCVKMAAFLVVGVYRGLWRYTSVGDLVIYAKAVALGSVASIITLLFAFRFAGLSRAAFIVDGLLLLVLLAGSRMAFRLFRQVLPDAHGKDGRRVLIYGAGDGGELLLREIRNNRVLRMSPVGFVDDDPHKRGKVIHGLRVWNGNGDLSRVCDEQRIEEVLISSANFTSERVEEILRHCAERHITVRRMRIEIETLSDE